MSILQYIKEGIPGFESNPVHERAGSETKNLIVVDIQPLYEDSITFDMNEFIDFLLSTKNKILWFHNGPKSNKNEQGESLSNDTSMKIKRWLLRQNRNIKNMDWSRVKFVDKSYSFFARWMNEPIYLEDNTMIKVIRYMYMNRIDRIDNSLKISTEDLKLLVGEEEYKKLEHHIDKKEYYVELPKMISLSKLKEFSGSLICGGKEQYCLKEVQLLMSAFNLSYTTVDKFTYV